MWDWINGMNKTYIANTIYPPLANYSHAASGEGPFLFISGQIGIKPDGTLSEDVLSQAYQCFENIDAILGDAKLDVSHVLRINAYVTDRKYLAEYMKARDKWIGNLEFPPASTLMIVAGFAQPEMKVEVEVTAGFSQQS